MYIFDKEACSLVVACTWMLRTDCRINSLLECRRWINFQGGQVRAATNLPNLKKSATNFLKFGGNVLSKEVPCFQEDMGLANRQNGYGINKINYVARIMWMQIEDRSLTSKEKLIINKRWIEIGIRKQYLARWEIEKTSRQFGQCEIIWN